MKSALFGLAASLAAPVSGTFVVQCYSRLFDQRADPVVSPGVASSHGNVIDPRSQQTTDLEYQSILSLVETASTFL